MLAKLLPILFLTACATAPRINFRAEAYKYENTIDIGDIDEDSLVSVLDKIKAAQSSATLRIDSPGGEVFAGMRFIRDVSDVKKQNHLHLNCVVDGKAYSMAAVLLQSPVCDTRLATPASTLLFHNGHGKASGSANDMQSAGMLLEALNVAMAVVVSDRMHMALPEYRKRIAVGDWSLAVPDALAVGALDGVVSSADVAPPAKE